MLSNGAGGSFDGQKFDILNKGGKSLERTLKGFCKHFRHSIDALPIFLEEKVF